MAEVDANAGVALKLTEYDRIKDTSHRFYIKPIQKNPEFTHKRSNGFKNIKQQDKRANIPQRAELKA